jgi:hypothetical protein
MGVPGPSIYRVCVASGKHFGVSTPGKPKGKNPCLRKLRNSDHQNPEMACGVNKVKESRDLIVIIDHPEKITTIDLG